MMSYVERIRTAGDFINRAREEETPTGNPATAARNYICAMEIIASVADEIPINDPNARRFFFYQLRQRMELYYERAELLLGVAEDGGLVDKPIEEGGLTAALARLGGCAPPPPTAAAASCGAVMGIPVAQPAQPGFEETPPALYYFSEPPNPVGTVPTTSGFSPEELDALFKSCDFQKSAK